MTIEQAFCSGEATMKGYLSILACLGWSTVSSGVAIAQPAQPVTISGAVTYDKDSYINATSLVISPGTSITVANGATLTIVADSATIGANVVLNARGKTGDARSDHPAGKGDWHSGALCHGSLTHNCGTAGSAHQAWLNAIDDTNPTDRLS